MLTNGIWKRDWEPLWDKGDEISLALVVVGTPKTMDYVHGRKTKSLGSVPFLTESFAFYWLL